MTKTEQIKSINDMADELERFAKLALSSVLVADRDLGLRAAQIAHSYRVTAFQWGDA